MDYFEENPWAQDAEIQAKWDELTQLLPVCCRCGEHITGARLVYIPIHDEYYCLDCIEAMTEFNEGAEVE